MNPSKNGWVLCPSTRMPGKFYYFNVVTGEAAWSLNDIERRMAARGNFVQAEKWHSYPEPLSPPDENSNTWNCPPGYRSFFQPMTSFGQAVFPKYVPNTDPYLPSPSWPMQPMLMPSMYAKPPMMNMPMSEPIWPMNLPRPKPEKNFFQNPFESNNTNMSKNFNQMQNRKVFPPRTTQLNNLNIFPPNNNFDRQMNLDPTKEPQPKKMRMHTETNPFGSKISENNDFLKTLKTSNISQTHTCNCMLSKSKEKVTSWLSKSQENVNLEQKSELNKSKQSTNILRATNSKEKHSDEDHSELSSTFTLNNSFVFPLKKPDTNASVKNSENVTNTSKVTPLINIKNAAEKKDTAVNLETNIGEEDLRYVLLAKRKRSFSESQSQEIQQHKVTKIRTRYSESQPREDVPKKRVTFNLGVESSCADDDLEDQNLNAGENRIHQSESIEYYYVVADLDVLLTEYQLLEDYVKTEQNCILLIPSSVSRAVSSAAANVSLGRDRVLAARSLTRLIAQAPDFLTVQPENNEEGVSKTEDPIIACCLETLEEGINVMLITNDEDLYKKAIALDIECYTTKEVLEYLDTPKPEVSFDLKKIEKINVDVIPKINTINSTRNNESDKNDDFLSKITVNCTRKTLFGGDNEINKVLNKNSEVGDVIKPVINRRFSLGDIKFPKENDDSKNDFLDRMKYLKTNSDAETKYDFFETASKISHEIEKLNLDDLIVPKVSQNRNEQKKVTMLLKNNNDDQKDLKERDFNKIDVSTQKNENVARKKIKNVNIYNLNELMKEFVVKTKEVEDRVLRKMDSFVCHFRQIMEDVLSDVLKTRLSEHEDSTKSPLQNLLINLRDVHLDHRTVIELVDRLNEALDSIYKIKNDVLTSTLILRPYEFMKILGYGTLLIKSLLSITPSNEQLQLGEELLEQLHGEVLSDSEPCSPRPAGPGYQRLSPSSAVHPRPDFAKNPADVLQYLQRHFPEWTSYKMTDDSDEKSIKQVTEKIGPKIFRTHGKNIGLLKFSKGNMFMSPKEDKNNNTSITKNTEAIKENEEKKKERKEKKNDEKELKFKEIDIEKREKQDAELLNMINEMVTSAAFTKSITKFYDLDNIIIKNNNETDETKHIDENKLKTVNEVETKANINENNKVETSNKENDNNNKTKEPLDLDVLDYSDMNDSQNNSVCENENCDVTTSDIVNENLEGIEGDTLNNESCSFNNDDSGIGSQVYSVVQLFLISLSRTFKVLLEFIKTTVIALKRNADVKKKEYIHDKADIARSVISRIINNLKNIIERESSSETAVGPMLLKTSPPHSDRRIVKYRQVVRKCLEQARILETSLKIVQKISRDNYNLSSISDASNNYINLFE